MSTAEHAFLPPSSAAAWVVCAMWPTMNQKYPETEPQEESLEGVTAHWGIAEQLEGREIKLGQIAPTTGKGLDEEMLEGIDVFLAASELARKNADTMACEQRLTGKRIHDTLNWGTPDLWTWKRSTATLDVFDYKHGHEHVEIYENFQLINYVALLFESLGINGGNDGDVTVNMHVVQPRSYTPDGPHRTWTVRGDDLRGYFNMLAGAAIKATMNDPKETTGNQCKHCPGRHACTALQRVAQSAADMSLRALPVELPPKAIGLELMMLENAAKRLEARITGLQAQAAAILRRGEQLPWYRLGSKQGREAWGKPVEEIIALGTALGVNVAKPGVLTPAQARKLGLPDGIVDAYMAPRGNAIVLERDDNTLAAKVFGKS